MRNLSTRWQILGSQHISVRFINIVIGAHRNPSVTRRSHTFSWCATTPPQWGNPSLSPFILTRSRSPTSTIPSTPHTPLYRATSTFFSLSCRPIFLPFPRHLFSSFQCIITPPPLLFRSFSHRENRLSRFTFVDVCSYSTGQPIERKRGRERYFSWTIQGHRRQR